MLKTKSLDKKSIRVQRGCFIWNRCRLQQHKTSGNKQEMALFFAISNNSDHLKCLKYSLKNYIKKIPAFFYKSVAQRLLTLIQIVNVRIGRSKTIALYNKTFSLLSKYHESGGLGTHEIY